MNLTKKLISFFKTKKIWNLPKKTSILIFDNAGSQLLSKYFNNYSFSILDTRWESINMQILLKSFIKNSNYFDSYINFVSPQILITFIDNNPSFYLKKVKHPKIVTIFIQNGVRSYIGDIFETLLFAKKNLNFHVDYMLCFNETVAKKYKQYIAGESIIIGSFKNNMAPIKNNFDLKTKTLIFISQYRKPEKLNSILFYNCGQPIYWNDFFSSEMKLLPLLFEYCQRKKINFAICGCSIENVSDEIKFYNKILGTNKWQYKSKSSEFSSYQIIDESNFVITIDSTLGIEALTRNKRVAFFSCRPKSIGYDDSDILWPNNYCKSGSFWTSEISKEEFERVMNFTIEESDLNWNKRKDNIQNLIMTYDHQNKKFQNLIESILNNNIYVKQ